MLRTMQPVQLSVPYDNKYDLPQVEGIFVGHLIRSF